MFKMRYASEYDIVFWYTLDSHLSENEFALKVRDKRCYVLCDDDKPVGVMRYNLMWDYTPFLTLIFVDESYRGKGYGKQALLAWEAEMYEIGYKMVMTSTQVNEEAQHFYRKLGYYDRGGIFLDGTPSEQPQEMFMIKVLQVQLEGSGKPIIDVPNL